MSHGAPWLSALGQLTAAHYVTSLGGLDLTGKAAVLKTAARERFGVRIPGPPSLYINNLRTLSTGEGFVFGHILGHIGGNAVGGWVNRAVLMDLLTGVCSSLHWPDASTGGTTPRVRSLKVSFAPFLHLKLHS